jgi:hypothetical protein
MKGNGAIGDIDVHLAQPGPLKVPKTFCEPCAMKIAPSASRNGSVTHEEEVAVNLRSMAVTLSIRSVFGTTQL